MNLRDALCSSPTIFPLNLDATGTLVQVVSLSESDYREASFLDNRAIKPNSRLAVIPWRELAAAAVSLTANCDFIFHISHAGSTLLSRLLGNHSHCHSVREPAILRLLVQEQYSERLSTFLGLWSRTFRSEQRTILKATSFVSEIGSELMNLVLSSRALLMYVPPETFLPSLLDGAMSDITNEANSRLARLQNRGYCKDLILANLSPGECVAMSWLSEMLSLADIAKNHPERTLWIHFEHFLKEPELQLSLCLQHLAIQADASSILSSTTMDRYAKRPDVKYDTAFRQKLIAQSTEKFQDEVQRGLRWLSSNESALAHLPT